MSAVPETDRDDETGQRFKVEKQSFSRGAWRVLDLDGRQVVRNEMFDHPFLGAIPVAGPVCFDRKRDALAWVRQHEAGASS